MVLYPGIGIAVIVFIVISLRRRDRLSTGRPDVSETERTVSYLAAVVAAVLLLLTLVV